MSFTHFCVDFLVIQVHFSDHISYMIIASRYSHTFPYHFLWRLSMTYEQFKSEICRQIQQRLAPGTSIQLQQIRKNNGLVLDGLIISNSQSNISPTIFLNYYYEKQNIFPDLDAVCRDILLTYEHNKSSENMDLDFFTEYDLVKDYLAYRIVNYEKNKELLKTVPHLKYLDLAVIYYCLLKITEKGHATILIHNSHLKLWNITPAQLHAQTCQTTPRLLPCDFRNMSMVLSDAFGDTGSPLQSPAIDLSDAFSDTGYPLQSPAIDISDAFSDIGSPFQSPAMDLSGLSSGTDSLLEHITPAAESFCTMYVLTNSYKLYGASCILYPGLLQQIAEQLGTDLLILPSSIHEVIILPAVSSSHHAGFRDMVAEINQTELAVDEVLSSRIYHYSRSKKALSICP